VPLDMKIYKGLGIFLGIYCICFRYINIRYIFFMNIRYIFSKLYIQFSYILVHENTPGHRHFSLVQFTQSTL
jgi:hypothetical protein